ncbi:MAG: DUF885 domain-containing protein [Chloroflexota bacterium]|nr:DUF885 domain-containing protein [Chloroflexota bacterium]
MNAAPAAPSGPLEALADEFWQAYLRAHPTFATAIGDRRYDAFLEDLSPEGRERRREALDGFAERARAIPDETLSGADRVTRSALIDEADGEIALLDARLEEWTVDPLDGPQVSLFNIESFQPVGTVEQGHAMVRRWQQMPAYVDTHSENLRRGLAARRVAVRDPVERVVDQLSQLLTTPDADWALLRPIQVEHHDWTEGERNRFRDDLARTVRDGIRPALERYRRLLESEILPSARPQELAGLMHLPGGTDAYPRLIRVHTSLQRTPQQLHAVGQAEVARVNAQMEALSARVLGTADRAEARLRLRTDPALYFSTRDEVAEKAESALNRATEAIPGWFGRLPRARCVVARMGEHEEKHSTIAYYRPPATDGSRPGQYYVNTYAPETRPRYEAEVLAYHEAIPGHHLQLAIAQELEALPEFRRHLGVTAFVEGWGLYTERLSDEMGLYSGELDRLGLLSYDAWRACRLVVDTGMHALGWSRQQAVDFMLANTALAENNVRNEIDRYIVWPAQALAYKTGQLEILRLRELARDRLGERFDIRAFHDVLLGEGAPGLETLDSLVRSWLERLP